MDTPDNEDLEQFVEFHQSPEGVSLVMKPGASKIPFQKILAFARSSNISGIDIVRSKLAWVRSDGRPVIVAPPVPKSAVLDKFLRTEESGAEVVLVIDPVTPAALPLNDVVDWLNARHFSGLDLELIRQAVNAPRGTPQRITSLPDGGEVSASSPAPSPAATVLLSGADASALQASAAALAHQGLGVRRSSGPEMTVFEATQHLPDAIILDTSLGISTALGTCRQLTANPRTRSIPVLVSCREATREFLSQAMEAGAKDFLIHPISASVLTRKLTKLLEASGRSTPDARGPRAAAGGGVAPRTLGKIDLDKLIKQVAELAAIPAVVERVMRISRDEQAGAGELAKAVSLDQAATALVLRVANSFAFGASKKIDNVAEAVTRIGFRQTRSLVVGRGVIGAFTPKTQSVGFDRVGCWRHSLATAILAKQIADQIPRVSTDVAFIAGLLHDVGKVLLDEFSAPDFEAAVHKGIQDHIPLKDAEQETLQTTHVEVATQALRAWKFPDEVVSAVRFHHGTGLESAGLSAEDKALCQAVYAANSIAKATGIGPGGDTFISEIARSVWDELKLVGGLPDSFWLRFDKEFRQSHSFLGITYADHPGFVANRGVGVVHEEDPSPVSLLRVVLESAGWTVTRGSEPGLLPRDLPTGGPAFVAVRGSNAASLAALMKRWEPVTGTVPLIGLLPAGCVAPVEGRYLVEPYDRDDLMKFLPKSAAAAP